MHLWLMAEYDDSHLIISSLFIDALSNSTTKPDLFVPSSLNQKVTLVPSFPPLLSSVLDHRCNFSEIKTWRRFSALPSYPFHTQTLSCVLLVSVCLCVLVAPSQKEDLIATVMAGKIIATHLLWCKNDSSCFCATVLHPIIDFEGDWLLQILLKCYSVITLTLSMSVSSDIQVQSVEELKQHKGYLKLLKKQSKELKELRKKHLKKVKTVEDKIEMFLLHKQRHCSAWPRVEWIKDDATQWMWSSIFQHDNIVLLPSGVEFE